VISYVGIEYITDHAISQIFWIHTCLRRNIIHRDDTQIIKSHARTPPPRILIRNSHRHQPSTSLAPRDDARRSAGLRARFPARTACESTRLIARRSLDSALPSPPGLLVRARGSSYVARSTPSSLPRQDCL
jgi:hypothetical protein